MMSRLIHHTSAKADFFLNQTKICIQAVKYGDNHTYAADIAASSHHDVLPLPVSSADLAQINSVPPYVSR
jgi:hypothetical protein